MESIPGKIVGGKLILNERSLYLFSEKNEGKHVELRVLKKERSLGQLGMYRAWLRDVANHTGNDDEDLHEFLLDKLAPRVVIEIRGKKGVVETTKYKRTSGGKSLTMTKLEMGEFMDKAAALTGYPLPTREELEAMGYILNY